MGRHLTTARIRREAEYIHTMAPVYGERTGELLFNVLRHEIADVVRNTNFDPFYEDLDTDEIVEWLETHILYDNDGNMIRLFDERGILWEDEKYAA